MYRWIDRHRAKRLIPGKGGLYPEQVEHWQQATKGANEKPVLTLKEKREWKLLYQKQLEIKALTKELHRKEKAMADMAASLVLQKSRKYSAQGRRMPVQNRSSAHGVRANQRGSCR